MRVEKDQICRTDRQRTRTLTFYDHKYIMDFIYLFNRTMDKNHTAAQKDLKNDIIIKHHV